MALLRQARVEYRGLRIRSNRNKKNKRKEGVGGHYLKDETTVPMSANAPSTWSSTEWTQLAANTEVLARGLLPPRAAF